MWDAINYEKNGVLDWQQLINDRAGTFINRLHGISVSESGYIVFYKNGDSFRCMSVNTTTTLHEANCYTDSDMVLVSENEFDCG